MVSILRRIWQYLMLLIVFQEFKSCFPHWPEPVVNQQVPDFLLPWELLKSLNNPLRISALLCDDCLNQLFFACELFLKMIFCKHERVLYTPLGDHVRKVCIVQYSFLANVAKLLVARPYLNCSTRRDHFHSWLRIQPVQAELLSNWWHHRNWCWLKLFSFSGTHSTDFGEVHCRKTLRWRQWYRQSLFRDVLLKVKWRIVLINV